DDRRRGQRLVALPLLAVPGLVGVDVGDGRLRDAGDEAGMVAPGGGAVAVDEAVGLQEGVLLEPFVAVEVGAAGGGQLRPGLPAVAGDGQRREVGVPLAV